MNHQSTNNGKKDVDKKKSSITNFFAAHVTPKETPTAPKPTKSNKSKSTKSNDIIAPSICIDKDFNLGDDETATTTVLRKRKKVEANSAEKSGNEGTPPKKVAAVRFFLIYSLRVLNLFLNSISI